MNLQQILNQQFLNKRITVPIPDRDNHGRVIPNKFTSCSGICQYIGSNNVLNYDLQVTVNGMPIQITHINNIVLTPQPNHIRKVLSDNSLK